VNDALVISNALLWIAVLALAAVVAALLRQIGVLHERIAPAGALVARGGPAFGAAAPRIAAQDWNGEAIEIGAPDRAGTSTLLLFVSARCPVCATLLPLLDSLVAAEAGTLRVVLASDGPRAEHEGFVSAHGLAEPGRRYVLSTELGLAYRVASVPFGVLIDAEGIVRAQGLVNSREQLESLLEARERGVAHLQEWLERESPRRVA
jgi:methylamine dehydrogenase accessory protein MauD